MRSFEAELEIIGINPFVFVPDEVLGELFQAAGRRRGPIPIRGLVNGEAYRQTLVRFLGAWRLYVNMEMLADSPRRIGERLLLTVEYDPSDRGIEPHPDLVNALRADAGAEEVFGRLPPSAQKEIHRYLHSLRTEPAIQRNIQRAIEFLHGRGRFLGRDAPTGR